MNDTADVVGAGVAERWRADQRLRLAAVKPSVEDCDRQPTEPLMHQLAEVADDLLVMRGQSGGDIVSALDGNLGEASFPGLVFLDDIADGVPDGALEAQRNGPDLVSS